MKKKLKKLLHASEKENDRFYKELLSRGKIALSHPIIFYPIMVAAIYIDYVPIRDAMLKASSSWSVFSLTAFSLLTAFILNGGMKIVTWIAGMESRTLLKNIILGSVILTIIGFYILSCGIKWSTRYDLSSEINYSNNVDPALQALLSSQSLEDSSWVETTNEPVHDIATDFVCLLSCLAPAGTSVLICSIGYDPDPFRKERYQKQRRRKKIIKLLSENESVLVELSAYIKEIGKQQKIIEEKIASEREEEVILFQRYLEVHARYMLAMSLGNAEALTYLIQENAYVEALFPST